MTRLRVYVPAAARGVLLAVCLTALIAATAWGLYVNGWIGADGFVAVLRLSIIDAVSTAIFGMPFCIAALWLHDRWLARRPITPPRPSIAIDAVAGPTNWIGRTVTCPTCRVRAPLACSPDGRVHARRIVAAEVDHEVRR